MHDARFIEAIEHPDDGFSSTLRWPASNQYTGQHSGRVGSWEGA
jgi:hypothetical protein